MTAVEWFIEQIKEYDFTPPSNNEEYVIVMPKWIFDAKRDEAKEMESDREYEIKAFWFGRGINAGRENKIEELKPKKD